jgi:low affinity Fe/Cu permease
MYHEHHQSTGPVQRLANRAPSALGRPLSLAIIVVLIAGWIGSKSVVHLLGATALEEFPFPELALIVT